jgi:hypothetical protein
MQQTQMLRLYMKSGNIVEIPAADWHLEGSVEGLFRLRWEVSDDSAENPLLTKLIWVSLPDIEAVVVQDVS